MACFKLTCSLLGVFGPCLARLDFASCDPGGGGGHGWASSRQSGPPVDRSEGLSVSPPYITTTTLGL